MTAPSTVPSALGASEDAPLLPLLDPPFSGHTHTASPVPPVNSWLVAWSTHISASELLWPLMPAQIGAPCKGMWRSEQCMPRHPNGTHGTYRGTVPAQQRVAREVGPREHSPSRRVGNQARDVNSHRFRRPHRRHVLLEMNEGVSWGHGRCYHTAATRLPWRLARSQTTP